MRPLKKEPSSHPGLDRMELEEIAVALAQEGLSIREACFPRALVDALYQEASQMFQSPRLSQSAGVGRGSQYRHNPEIRTDRICWLDPESLTEAQRAYWEALEELRLWFNRRLFLNLAQIEAFLAEYPVGAFYKRHVDQFRNNRERVISTVLYLNPEWKAEDGGQLRIHGPIAEDETDPEDAWPEPIDVFPQRGRLVLFRSEDIAHEVLPTHRPRYSATAWFRRRP